MPPAGEIHVLGVRHHGPGSARMVLRALAAIQPDAILIEGPPDAADVLPFAKSASMVPPVALLIYDPQTPSDGSFYPFAEFSPEWQALRWGLAAGADVRFIDLPHALRPSRAEQPAPTPTPAPASSPSPNLPPIADDLDLEEAALSATPATSPTPTPAPSPAPAPQPDDESSTPSTAPHAAPRAHQREDPLEALARAAGFTDGEAWWGRFIEERRADDNPLDLFASISDAMASAREQLGPSPNDPLEPAREAHMRKCIRTAIKDGFSRIAVVCGAWHAPVLTSASIKSIPAKADDAILKPLTKRKTAATWIPWTYDRLAFASGYGAGVISPGWYEHIWQHDDHISTRWLTKVARFMRDEGLDAAPASVIEAVRLADSLASLRGRTLTNLDDLSEATLSILCHADPLPMRIIAQKLIVGIRLGQIPDDAPSVPIQQDLAAQQKSLRMKVSAVEAVLDLDQRKEIDLSRSHLLHRLNILDVPWGTLAQDQRQRSSTFHEVWRLQWKPEFAIPLITAARWGNTVADAAATCVREKAAHAVELAQLTELLDDVMLADLPGAVEVLMARIQAISAVASSIHGLMDALPPLGRILRYGNVRNTDAALVEPLVVSLLARICAGLIPACASLDDDAAEKMSLRLQAVASTLKTLARDDLSSPRHAELHKLASSSFHGIVAGWACRALVDEHAMTADHAATRLSLAVSPGNDPALAANWIEGFLRGSGSILVHDASLLAIIDQWLSSLTDATFEQICPVVRRTFSTFESPERRKIGETIKRGVAAPRPTSDQPDLAYDPSRGSLVDPVLMHIFGAPLP